VSDYYYRRLEPDGEYEVFDSSDITRSNWDPTMQHASPPLALLTKAIEQLLADSRLRIGRLTLDILAAIPVSPVRVRAWVDRPGRRISLLIAEMTPADADARRPVARVTAWALATSDTSDVASDRYPPLFESPPEPLPDNWWNLTGYLGSIDWRRQLDDPSGAVWWVSPQGHLVDGEDTTALEKLALVVDSSNGVGSVLDFKRFVFMNTDTAMHLHRLPTGEDFALRARGSIGPDGIGVTTSELFDRDGFVGVCAQTLLIQRR
jgi:acyl-Coa thioesterase superfamily protein/acyl-CoA thioesterase superfamily protein